MLNRKFAQFMIEDQPDVTAYAAICAAFSGLTDIQSDLTGVCCLDVDKHCAPKCCYTLTNGTCHLTFTDLEMKIIRDIPGSNPVENGISYQFYPAEHYWRADVRDVKKMRQSLKDGVLSKTLECVSHPTRPILKDGVVTGVAVVHDCMAEYALDELRKNKDDFIWLWQKAVDLLGVKPYYITRGFDKPDQFEVL